MSQVLDKLKELDKERQKLVTQAKKTALDKAQSAIDELNELGFNYQIVERSSKSSGRKGTRQVSDQPCPICKFKTNPPHDGRRHKGQYPETRPFNDAELKEMGMTRVSS